MNDNEHITRRELNQAIGAVCELIKRVADDLKKVAGSHGGLANEMAAIANVHGDLLRLLTDRIGEIDQVVASHVAKQKPSILSRMRDWLVGAS